MSHALSNLNAAPVQLNTADGELPAIALRRGEDRALVALHGGQLLSWVPACGGERLYLSANMRYGEGASIRGGVPVIFPQFADRGPLPRHGLVRSRAWAFAGLVRSDADGEPAAEFALDDDPTTRAHWPHSFALRLRIGLAPNVLTATLSVRNTGATPFAFACALHSYVRVAGLRDLRIEGLSGLPYRDRARPAETDTIDTETTPRFDREIDRLYVGATGDKRLRDAARSLRIQTAGFTDTVVWNPGAALAATMADLAPGDHDRFVCIEPACVEPAVALPPDAHWCGRLRMRAEDP